jgi:hypothetical protein
MGTPREERGAVVRRIPAMIRPHPKWEAGRPVDPSCGLEEMREDYMAILSGCDGDRKRARMCFEAYLAGRNGMMPPKANGGYWSEAGT